jgi:hypothetical protein
MAKVPCSMRGRKNLKRVPSSVSRFGDENVNFLSRVLVRRGEPSWPVHAMSSRPGGIVRDGILVLGPLGALNPSLRHLTPCKPWWLGRGPPWPCAGNRRHALETHPVGTSERPPGNKSNPIPTSGNPEIDIENAVPSSIAQHPGNDSEDLFSKMMASAVWSPVLH